MSPALTAAGPDLAIETMGRCSFVVTGGGGAAVIVPVGAIPLAVAVAFSTVPSTAESALKYEASVCPLALAAGTGTLKAPDTDAEAPGANEARAGVLLELNGSGAAFCGGWGPG